MPPPRRNNSLWDWALEDANSCCSDQVGQQQTQFSATSPQMRGDFYHPSRKIPYHERTASAIIPFDQYDADMYSSKSNTRTMRSSMADATYDTQDVSRFSEVGSYGIAVNDERKARRGFITRAVAVIVITASIFGIGIAVGSVVRSRQAKNLEASNSAGSPRSFRSSAESRNSSDILVGAYYYPWHGSNFHNGDGYVRSQLEPQHFPTLGEYDDSNPDTIAQHLKWSRQANIGLWITSWWGPNRLEDSNTKDVILQHKELGDMKIALHYETTGRIRDGDMNNVLSDMTYICETYFEHPNYYRIDGRPVLFVYITRKLQQDGFLEKAMLTMRSMASKCDENLFIVADHVFEDAPTTRTDEDVTPFVYFDAVTNYDVYGSMGRPSPFAGSSRVEEYYLEQGEWKIIAGEHGCRYLPAVSPGYNDRGVRMESDHPPLSRRLTFDDIEGSLFAYAIENAKKLVDPAVDNLLVVNSFNEWHEDTQIEPVMGEITNSPDILTGGLDYSGYGELYLNILRRGTLPEESTTSNNIFGATR